MLITRSSVVLVCKEQNSDPVTCGIRSARADGINVWGVRGACFSAKLKRSSIPPHVGQAKMSDDPPEAPAMIRRPARSNDAARAWPPRPCLNTAAVSPFVVRQTPIVPSSLAVTTSRPSLLKSMLLIASVWPQVRVEVPLGYPRSARRCRQSRCRATVQRGRVAGNWRLLRRAGPEAEGDRGNREPIEINPLGEEAPACASVLPPATPDRARGGERPAGTRAGPIGEPTSSRNEVWTGVTRGIYEPHGQWQLPQPVPSLRREGRARRRAFRG
jgi:hypothetical protein